MSSLCSFQGASVDHGELEFRHRTRGVSQPLAVRVWLLAALCLLAWQVRAVTPDEVAKGWSNNGDVSIYTVDTVTDDLLGRPVMEVMPHPLTPQDRRTRKNDYTLISRAPVEGGYLLDLSLRFPAVSLTDPKTGRASRPGTGVTVMLGAQENASSPALIFETGVGGSPRYSWTLRRADAPRGEFIARGSQSVNITPSISPLSPEAFRLETEWELSRLPHPGERWLPLRVEARADLVRFYFNGILAAEVPRDGTFDGLLGLRFTTQTRVDRLAVRTLADSTTAPFVTVPLDSRCNAAGLLAGTALDAVRNSGKVGRVPFLLPATVPYDHVDLGQAINRYRMGTSYTAHFDPRVTMPAPSFYEPGRITLAVPGRAYRRAWVLAAFDDRAHHTSLLTLRFYKPNTDWSIATAVHVPSLHAREAAAQPHPVKTTEGKDGNLWLVPIELDSAALAGDFPGSIMSIELTKEIKPNVPWPDPANYAYQAGGLPSGVRLYGLTLEEAPVHATAAGSVFGNTYTDPDEPVWQVTVRNQLPGERSVDIGVEIIDAYAQMVASLSQRVKLAEGETRVVAFPLELKVFGLHTARTTVSVDGWRQIRDGQVLRLPAFARRETGATSPWGVWSWGGTHGTHPVDDDIARLLKALGAINQYDLVKTVRRGEPPVSLNDFRAKWGLGPTHDRIIPRNPPAWAAKDPVDPEEYAAYREQIGLRARQLKQNHPDFQYVNCFAENSVSLRLTHGVRPEALGLPPYTLTDQERTRIRHLLTAALAGAEGVRQHAPGVKFLFGHGSAHFPIPFFNDPGWRFDLFDGFGLDLPQFERMPERQPRATEPSLLYFLKEELKVRGQQDKELVHLESYFPPSHELALGLRGQADSVVRTAVLSLALGTTRFMHTWSLQDCADRWGSQHYGGCGLYARIPESNPKPAAAAFATMTRVLDKASYETWLPTGSHSAFCVAFRDGDRRVYAVWTIRGQRPLDLTFDKNGLEVERVDENGNAATVPLDNLHGRVELTSTPCWLIVHGGRIIGATAGAQQFDEAPEGIVVKLDDFEQGGWRHIPGVYPRFGSNNWDVVRHPLAMRQELRTSEARGSRVWRIEAVAPVPTNAPVAGYYGVFEPERPLAIPGKARAIGLYARGGSQWFRVVYELEDANGESWISCGQKDAWNSDDIHSRSSINFDGWRYMEFPLPSSAPGDNYREIGCYSWGCDDDGIVDLPLRLRRIIIEMRSHVLYVDKMVALTPDEMKLELDDLVVVYAHADDTGDAPVKLQRATVDACRPPRVAVELPNPIARLRASAVAPAAIEKLYPPETMASGDQIYVKVRPVEGAVKYTVYVAAYEDGRGAIATGRVADAADQATIWVRGLQPAIPMYFFATWTDAEGQESQPSAPRKVVLRDEFPFK